MNPNTSKDPTGELPEEPFNTLAIVTRLAAYENGGIQGWIRDHCEHAFHLYQERCKNLPQGEKKTIEQFKKTFTYEIEQLLYVLKNIAER